MSTVDEILASGEYESRAWGLIQRCREACPGNGLWVCAGHFEPWEHLTTEQVKKAIERDQHECAGLWTCETHPTPYVVKARHGTGWWAMPARKTLSRWRRDTLPEAMDAARALAVGP